MSEAHSHADTHSQQDYSGVMGIYNKLKGIGLKSKADEVMASISRKYTPDNPAPPEVIQQGLEGILAKHKSSAHEIPEASHQTHTISSSRTNLLGLAAIIAGIAFLSSLSGMPMYYTPPLY